ncbi:uncharacterized protein LOC111006120 [Momordica charantia]|uniref:Uncharacterized protein LOC111006120 n=1 Tax=Momordica charantia TaxID=3673 RepID=A0A6J1BVM7_MOMCH|nr:uncharacterized protein LOC111006120 [Momordica charantia]XP_022133570.1 uncharacterized protein LOC111006120 [Momordica charantia]XP_022133571.1 uncharacterized protein LOC111006120 [Momordica charantia]XP_022133573.1 uncharacterized protein LOC111006120 [Momordica charantia]XP_022133574.1 uncharacterized protein LOC111006120 [Momordica charantia]XP_022133575.1 uncharacterized protein LOC111006120 [Momordica charantia]XP_022133576.1 uncharacterized protein LOC111006120 [Momordica charanti
MAMPESEEVCFKRIGLSASDYDACLPIKKRRFPLVQSPPSPSKDISSFHPDGNLVKTEQPSSSKDISVNPNGNLMKTEQPSPSKDISSFHRDGNLIKTEQPGISATTVSSSSAVTSYELSNKNQECVFDENKGKSDTDSCYLDRFQSKIGMAGVKFQEPQPNLGDRACFSDYVDDYVEYEEKSLITEKHTLHASSEIPGGLKLSSTSLNFDPLTGNEEEEIAVKNPEEKRTSPICQVEGRAALSVGLKGHMVPKLVPENNDITLLKHSILEPVLLDLSLSKQGSSSPCVRGSIGSDYDGSILHSNRENWDLNTSMESWEGCTSDAAAVQISATQTNMDVGTYVCSSEMVEGDSPRGKQIPLDSEHRDNSINACVPSKDHLHLSLHSSYPKPTLEEDPYLSDYESDGNWDLADAVDYDDNNVEEDYEDGEVRETMLETEVEVHECEKREVERFDHADCDDKKINYVGLPDQDSFTLGLVEQEAKPEHLDVRNEDDVHTATKCKSSEQENEDLCEKEVHAVENTINEDVNRPVKATGRSQLSLYDKQDNFEGQATADKNIDGIQELISTVSQHVENAIAVDVVQNKDVALPNVKESVNSDDAKDVNGGIKNSRIINLNRASSDSTPCKVKSSFVRPVLSRTDRDFIPNMALEGANVQPQERDHTFGNTNKKISVDRHQDPSPWMNFSRRRGRNSNRLDTRSGEWNLGPNFSPETYSDQQIDYHVPGLDQNRYDIIPDGPFGGASHRGRQLLDDEGPFFHGPSRRKSPGRRHGGQGGKMVNRIHRDFSPSRCMDEGGSFDRQHGENFTRNFPDGTMDPIYARPQPPYEDDRSFFRERRNFSFQRKGFPRIDSKSPVRSRARSPGQWFPSKRSDRFCGRPGMTHRRSPNYRTDRMRSPDQRPMGGHMAARRHGFRFISPSDDMRDVGPVPPDHGHMRSIIPNRNQTERLSLRNRSYDGIDPRGRIESDELFDDPVRSGQLSGCSGGNHDDDERIFNERHEPLHSFKHPYDDSDGERFRNNAGDCSRPFRFCSENDSRISWKRR